MSLNNKNLKTLVLSFFGLLIMFSARSVTAQTTDVVVTADLIYGWAQAKNAKALNYVKQYIDLEDENGDTALCMAQKNKDKESYKMLLVFGASTKAACHNDKDPICALAVHNNKQLNGGALFWGAAAAGVAGYTAYELTKSKDHSCSDGYSKQYTSVDDCGTSGANGWNFTAGANGCGKCTAKACPIEDNTQTSRGSSTDYSTPSHCPSRHYMLVMSTNIVNYSGDDACYRCNYACDNETGYSAQDLCQASASGGEGYTCAQDEDTGCWYKATTLTCPDTTDFDKRGSDPRYTDSSYCPYRKYMAVKNTTVSGHQGDYTCYTCNYTCDESVGFTDIATCNQNTLGENAYNCSQDNDTRCYYRTSVITCPSLDSTTARGSSTHYTEVNECPFRTYMKTLNVTPITYSGEEQCFLCKYACDETTGFTAESSCTQNANGEKAYNCSQDSNTQCYYRLSSIGCPTTNTATVRGGSISFTSPAQCPGRTYMTALRVVENGNDGETPCYDCHYVCDETTGFAFESTCTQNGAYICTQDSDTKCYYRSQSAGCPTGTSTEYKFQCPDVAYRIGTPQATGSYSGTEECYACTYACDETTGFASAETCSLNKVGKTGYTCNADEASSQTCYYRTGANSCRSGYSTTYQTQSNCANNGGTVSSWTFTYDDTNYAGELLCGKCTTNGCPSGASTAYSDANQCPAVTDMNVISVAPTGDYDNDKLCYKCNYKCDTENGAYDSKEECLADGNESAWLCNGLYLYNTCWYKGMARACETGYSTQYPDQASCDTTGATSGQGYTFTTSHNSGDSVCGACTVISCPTDPHAINGYMSTDPTAQISNCQSGYQSVTPSTSYSGNSVCYQCSSNGCTEGSTITSADECGTSGSKGWTITDTGYRSGEDICYKCEAKTCPADESTSITCASGYEKTEDTENYNGDSTCYKCESLTCSEGCVSSNRWTSTSYTSVSDCPSYTFDPNQWSFTTSQTGEEQCSTCNFQCSGTYSSEGSMYGTYKDYEYSTDCYYGYGWECQSLANITGASCFSCYLRKPVCYIDSVKQDSGAPTKLEDCYTTSDGTFSGNANSWTLYTKGAYYGGKSGGCGKCVAKTCSEQGLTASSLCESAGGTNGIFTFATDKTGEKIAIDDRYEGSKQCYKCSCQVGDKEAVKKAGCAENMIQCATLNGTECCKCLSSNTTTSALSQVEVVNNQDLTIEHTEGDYTSPYTTNALADEFTPEATGSVTMYNSTNNTNIRLISSTHDAYNAKTLGTEGTDYSATGNIALFNQNNADENTAIGLYASENAYNAAAFDAGTAHGLINIDDATSTTNIIYGMFAEGNAYNAYSNAAPAQAQGEITINTATDKQAYGIAAYQDIYNPEGSFVRVIGSGAGDLYGLKTASGSISNAGDVVVSAQNGNAYGLYAGTITGQKIENLGNITVSSGSKSAYGIYVENAGEGAEILNSGTITATGDSASRGIKIGNNGSNATVTNTGKIFVNGALNAADTAIDLNGATLNNSGEISFAGLEDLDTLNGHVAVEEGGSYSADSLSGNLNIAQSVVAEGNKDEYTAQSAVKAADVSKLNLSSDSAMFKAELRKNQNGNYDAVAVRQSFDNFAPNQSMATYLEENYKADRLENLYGRFKTATDVAGLTADIANATGADFLINLPQENLSALRNTTEILTDSVLQPTEEQNRVIGGADYYSQESDGKGLVTGYENNTTTAYMYGDKRIDNTNRLGLGVSVMQMSGSYDNGADRDETFINMFIPWMHKLSDKLHFASIFTLGYGFGDYDRGNNQEADIKDYVYGSTNKLVYSMNLADYAELEPSLILNVIGYYQDDMNENDLQISGGNHLSVEGGAGLFVKKELMDSKYGKLTARLGGVYYHEFAEPYKNIRAGFRGGQGSFTINDFANIYNRDRAVLSAVLNWDYKQINLYARYQQMLQELDTKNFDLGVKYNF